MKTIYELVCPSGRRSFCPCYKLLKYTGFASIFMQKKSCKKNMQKKKYAKENLDFC